MVIAIKVIEIATVGVVPPPYTPLLFLCIVVVLLLWTLVVVYSTLWP